MSTSCTPGTSLARAIEYMSRRWSKASLFLDAPNVPLDNNAAERALRGLVVGRNNHYGSKSRGGTEVAAVFYTLVESAKLCGVEPGAYLTSAPAAALRGAGPPLPSELLPAA